MRLPQLDCLMAKVNAPYKTWVSADMLIICILSPSLDDPEIGQVTSFFTELSLSDQITFAEHYAIEYSDLARAARKFNELSGMKIKMSTFK